MLSCDDRTETIARWVVVDDQRVACKQLAQHRYFEGG